MVTGSPPRGQTGGDNCPRRNAGRTSLVKEIDGALARAATGSLALSVMWGRNRELMGLLERLLMELEDPAGEAAAEPADAPAPPHLSVHARLSVRGLSVWEMTSFRERMAVIRAAS